MAETTTKLLKARPHFELLDGLRGVAALAVVVYHLMQVAAPHYAVVSIAHGYLAVDFFFCLSGFVIAYAYDNRMKALGILDFCKSRLIRLHPLVIIGSVLGLLSFLYDPCSDIAVHYSAGQKIIIFIASCLMIPYPVVQERNASIFHLNPPAWSLFWEYMATIFYALILVKLRAKVLWILVFCAVILLCYEARHAEYLAVGWNGDSFWGGGIRVLYSFPVGMLIYRSRLIIS